MADETPAPPAEDAEDEKRIYKVVTMSAELRDAVEKAAEDAKVSVAAMFRMAVAEKIGYDLASEPTTARRVKHASAEDKLRAHRIASYKASSLRSTAWNIQKAKVAKDAAKVAKLEAELDAIMADENWTPPAEVLAKIDKSVAEAMAKSAPAAEESDEEESEDEESDETEEKPES